MAIQSDLVWTGDYNGLVNGEFAERAVAAVKAFQKRNGGKETGVLNQPERAALAAAAKPKQEAVGWRMVEDAGERRAHRHPGQARAAAERDHRRHALGVARGPSIRSRASASRSPARRSPRCSSG